MTTIIDGSGTFNLSNWTSAGSPTNFKVTGFHSIAADALKNQTTIERVHVVLNTDGQNGIINDSAFEGCTSLTSVKITASMNGNSTGINDIREKAFFNCSSLKTLIIEDLVMLYNIGTQAFSGTHVTTAPKLKYVVIPNWADPVDFNETNFDKGGGPNGTIGNGAFGNCSDLEVVVLPDKLNQIDENAFALDSGSGFPGLQVIFNRPSGNTSPITARSSVFTNRQNVDFYMNNGQQFDLSADHEGILTQPIDGNTNFLGATGFNDEIINRDSLAPKMLIVSHDVETGVDTPLSTISISYLCIQRVAPGSFAVTDITKSGGTVDSLNGAVQIFSTNLTQTGTSQTVQVNAGTFNGTDTNVTGTNVRDLANTDSNIFTYSYSGNTTFSAFTNITPVTSAFVNTSNVTYTLNENITNGKVTFTQSPSVPYGSPNFDGNSPQSVSLGGSKSQVGTTTLSNPVTLKNGATYTISFSGTDANSNTGSETVANITFDITSPVFTINTPSNSATVNTSNINYDLSKTIASGTVIYTRTDITAADITHNLTENERKVGTSKSLSTFPTLVNGATYTIVISGTDAAGNTGNATVTGITFTTTPPEFTGITPSTGSSVNSTNVAYTLNESITSGSVTFTRTGGAEDSSPHVVTLSGAALTGGVHPYLPNRPTLVDGATYTISFSGTDAAGNTSAPKSVTGIIFDNSNPAFTNITPNSDSSVNTSNVIYTLSENIVSGYVAYYLKSITPGAGNSVYQLSGTELQSGTNKSLLTPPTLTNDAIYTIVISGTDAAGNNGNATLSNITFNDIPPKFTILLPTSGDNINYQNVWYTLSKNIASGTVTYTRTGGTAGSNVIHNLIGADLIAGENKNLSQPYPTLVSGTKYDIVIDGVDAATNTGSDTVTGVTFDNIPPEITINAPSNSATVNTSNITYTLSKNIFTGSVTFTRKNGSTADNVTYNLVGSQLNAGTTTLTNPATLVDGAIYDIVINGTDDFGNIGTSSAITITFITPSFTNITPGRGAFVNTSNVTYTLNEDITTGSISYTRTSGTAASNVTYNLGGDQLKAGTTTISNPVTLVDGAVYTISFSGTDSGGNSVTTEVKDITFDNTLPAFSNITPGTNGSITTSNITYDLNETLTTGTVTFTRISGTTDHSSPHVVNLTTSELQSGTNSLLTPPSLVDGAVYDILFSGTDAADNTGTKEVKNVSQDYPGFTNITPGTRAFVKTSNVIYTLNKNIESGSVTFTEINGTVDSSSPHVVNLTGSQLDVGTTTLSNPATLVTGAMYNILFSGTDATNTGTAERKNITFDNIPPTMIIKAKSAISNNVIINGSTISTQYSSYLNLTFTSSEATTNFNVNDITVSGGELSNFSGYGFTFSAQFTPTNFSQTGVVTIDVAANTFTDLAGNNNSAASQFILNYDNVKPTMTISSTTSGVSNGSSTYDDTIELTFTSSKATTNFVISDISVTGGTLSNFASTSSTIYTATFTPSGAGETTINVNAGTFTDSLDNTNIAATQFNWTYVIAGTPVDLEKTDVLGGPFNGYSAKQTIYNDNDSERAQIRSQLRRAWIIENSKESINGNKRVIGPFRAVMNRGDYLGRVNYQCNAPCQVNCVNGSNSNTKQDTCDNTGVAGWSGNSKFVCDSSDFIRYKKQQTIQYNYNDNAR